MNRKTIKDRILLFVTALAIVVGINMFIAYNGGADKMADELVNSGLGKICSFDPGNPECKAAQKALNKYPIASAQGFISHLPSPSQK